MASMVTDRVSRLEGRHKQTDRYTERRTNNQTDRQQGQGLGQTGYVDEKEDRKRTYKQYGRRASSQPDRKKGIRGWRQAG